MLGWLSAATARASRSKRSEKLVLGDLQGDVAVQTSVACAVDLAHAALAHERKDFVWAETVSFGEGHGVIQIRLSHQGTNCA
jgi:hypothetical protein